MSEAELLKLIQKQQVMLAVLEKRVALLERQMRRQQSAIQHLDNKGN